MAGIGIDIGLRPPTTSDRRPPESGAGWAGVRGGRLLPGAVPVPAPRFEEPGLPRAEARPDAGLSRHLAALRDRADELFQRFGPIKFYPPYPPHEPARAELVRQWNVLAREAARLAGLGPGTLTRGVGDDEVAAGLAERLRAELRPVSVGLTRLAEPLRDLA
jgi:hypothetical protein